MQTYRTPNPRWIEKIIEPENRGSAKGNLSRPRASKPGFWVRTRSGRVDSGTHLSGKATSRSCAESSAVVTESLHTILASNRSWV